MLIGELAHITGLTRETLRFYDREGLIRSHRRSNGYREYHAETVVLVNYIRTAQQLGFTLAEIGYKLPALWENTDPGTILTQLLAEKLHEIDSRIERLKQLRSMISEYMTQDCPFHPDTSPLKNKNNVS